MSSKARFCVTDADHAAMAAFVGGIQADEAALAAAQAARVRRLAEVTRFVVERTRTDPPRTQDMAMKSAAAELACAMRLSDRTVLTQMGDAIAMVDGFPATFAAWEAGRINRAHALAVVEFGTPLPHDVRVTFEADAIAVCERETPGRARPLLQRAAECMHPQTLEQRHRAAQDARRVRVVPLGDGMADVIVTTTITLAHAIMDRLTRQATVVKDARLRARAGVPGGAGADPDAGVDVDVDVDAVPEAGGAGSAGESGGVSGAGDAGGAGGAADLAGHGASAGASPRDGGGRPHPAAPEIIASDERTFDQIRADLVADVLLTGAPSADPTGVAGAGGLGAVRALVQVVVPVLTLLGQSDEPADLVGRSPIDPATARTLAGGAKGFDRILTHPVAGAVLHVDRYRSSGALQRFLRGRDIRCRFPGCRMPAIWCDKDHTKDAARGGPTRDDNLSHVCERHHMMKHATPWKVRQLAGGVMEWTSPLGHIYADLPPGADLPGATAASVRGAGRSPRERGAHHDEGPRPP